MIRRVASVAVAAAAMGASAAAHSCGHEDPLLQAEIRSAYDADVVRPRAARRAANASGRAFEAASGPAHPLRVKVFTKDLDDSSRYCINNKNANVISFKHATPPVSCGEKKAHDLTPAKRAYLVDEVLPEAIGQLSALLRVARHPGNLHVDSCGVFTVPSAHHTGKAGIGEADFVLYVSAAPAPTAAAWASTCGFHADGRPKAGRANFDPKSLNPKIPAANAAGLAVHELMHALGFSSSNFGESDAWSTRIPTKVVTDRRGIGSVTVLAGPASIREARRFYDCADLEGIELENEGRGGSVASHIERRVAFDDVMGPSSGLGVSRMTLAVFEDLKYYVPNYDALETDPRFSKRRPQFGKGRGCGFVREKCNTVAGGKGREFCFTQQNDAGCSPDGKYFGTCWIDDAEKPWPAAFRYFGTALKGGMSSYMDACPMPTVYGSCVDAAKPFWTGDVGPNSRCVTGVNFGEVGRGYSPGSWARCHQMKCSDGAVLFVGKGGETIKCAAKGDKVTPPGYSGHLVCPDPAAVCPTQTPELPKPKPGLPKPKPELPKSKPQQPKPKPLQPKPKTEQPKSKPQQAKPKPELPKPKPELPKPKPELPKSNPQQAKPKPELPKPKPELLEPEEPATESLIPDTGLDVNGSGSEAAEWLHSGAPPASGCAVALAALAMVWNMCL